MTNKLLGGSDLSSDKYFSGEIDFFNVYSQSLSDVQVSNLYAATLIPISSSAVSAPAARSSSSATSAVQAASSATTTATSAIQATSIQAIPTAASSTLGPTSVGGAANGAVCVHAAPMWLSLVSVVFAVILVIGQF